MALAREVKAIVAILSDQLNEERSAEEVAEDVINALDAVREKSHRFCTVTQVVGPNGPSRPYIIGPFSTYKRAMEGGQRGSRAQDEMTRMGLSQRFMVGLVVPNANLPVEFYKPTPEPTQLDGLRKLDWP